MQVGTQQLQTSVTYFSCVQNPGKENNIKHIGTYKEQSLQCPQQHGFTTGRSNTTHLLEAVYIAGDFNIDLLKILIVLL